MLLNRKKTIIAGVVLLFVVLSGAAGLYWGGRLIGPPSYKTAVAFRPVTGFFNPKILPETVLIRNKEYLCGDLEKISEEKVPGELVGMDRKALVDKFPVALGWSVTFTNPDSIVLTAKTDELCPLHCQYRHLGLYHGLLAIYEGPLGYKGRVLRVEKIPLDSLKPDFRVKLEQAMDFENQAHTTVDRLRVELEFDCDETLNAALENLDEHS
ncbi:MAG: hypothetical protein PHS52_05065 [Desulfotomaculaceae bacterium]|nr:hypothetical protein [Desulfotomaculaceae bacterium]